MGLPGIGISHPVEDWIGPGICYWTRFEEGVQRNLFRTYLEFMKGGDYPSTTFAESASAARPGQTVAP